jgi:hypothetical protein
VVIASNFSAISKPDGDFPRKLMTPTPPSVMLFLVQAAYSVNLIISFPLDAINGKRMIKALLGACF